jgi:hypothetical protein
MGRGHDEKAVWHIVKESARTVGVAKRGEGSVGDVKTSTWVPPSDADIAPVQRIGHDALVPGAKHWTRQFPFVSCLQSVWHKA